MSKVELGHRGTATHFLHPSKPVIGQAVHPETGLVSIAVAAYGATRTGHNKRLLWADLSGSFDPTLPFGLIKKLGGFTIPVTQVVFMME